MAGDSDPVDRLRAHVAACPIGFVDGRVAVHRSTDPGDVVSWVSSLHELMASVRAPTPLERRHMRLASATQVDRYAECHDLSYSDVSAVRDMARELRHLRTLVDRFVCEIVCGDPEPDKTAAYERMRAHDEGQRRALLVQCGICGVPPGHPCTVDGVHRNPHPQRVERGKEA